MPIKLFGFTLGKKDLTNIQDKNNPALVLPGASIDDGAVTLTQGAYYGTYVDLEGSVRNELELIARYREMSLHPECSTAIEDIVSQAITQDEEGETVKINLERIGHSDVIKKKIQEEFEVIKKLLNFRSLVDELFRRWYIDGRIFFHIMVDETNPKQGIQELRFIDPRKIRKVREVLKSRDPRTAVEQIQATSEYYVFNDRGVSPQSYTGGINSGTRIAPDSIVYVPSGMLDAKSVMVVGHLHKAIKALNQLRMIEDAVVIYRLSRAPERRIFYIDVGNLPKLKAEQYVHDIMVKYRNKLVYDASTGEIRDERKHLSMLEDFWLPRREGSKGTEITTLPGGANLGQLEDVIYFRKKLYQTLNVPMSRLEEQQGFAGVGRVTEITRDEIKFYKFIKRLRSKFSQIFNQVLRVQLALKGVCTTDEWDDMKELISYDFASDNSFDEMRDAEITRERVTLVTALDPFVGKYFSQEWVKRKILRMTEDEIEEIKKQIDVEGPPTPIDTTQSAPVSQPELPAPEPSIPNTPEIEDAKAEAKTPDLDAQVKQFSKKYK